MKEYLPKLSQGLKSNLLKVVPIVLLFVSLAGCEKQPGFDRLGDISGTYTITKATFLKSDNVTDSVSYTNFGTISFSDCKKNSTQSCPGEYKIADQPSVAFRASYIFGSGENNVLQLAHSTNSNIGEWALFGQYEIMEESDAKLILRSALSAVYFNNKPTGKVILELSKQGN